MYKKFFFPPIGTLIYDLVLAIFCSFTTEGLFFFCILFLDFTVHNFWICVFCFLRLANFFFFSPRQVCPPETLLFSLRGPQFIKLWYFALCPLKCFRRQFHVMANGFTPAIRSSFYLCFSFFKKTFLPFFRSVHFGLSQCFALVDPTGTLNALFLRDPDDHGSPRLSLLWSS